MKRHTTRWFSSAAKAEAKQATPITTPSRPAPLAAETVGQRSRGQSAERQPEQGGAQDGRQRRALHTPFRYQRRRDIADGRRVEPVQQDDEETQGECQPLVR